MRAKMSKEYGCAFVKKLKKASASGLTLLVALGFSMALVGCGDVTAVVKDKKNQLEKQFKDATVLERARAQLADAKKSRLKLKGIADQFSVDSEVSLKQVKRLENEKEKTSDAFKKLQDTARQAGLPKFSDATEEDLTKTLQIGTKNFTGADIYRVLREYKAQLDQADAAIEREHIKPKFLKDRAEKIRTQLIRVDSNIADMERKIADLEMYQELFAANKTIDSLGLSDDKMTELLNTESVLTELRKKIDASEVREEQRDREEQATGLKRELTGGSSFSVTDDDLI